MAQARTGTGLWISWPPFTKVPLDAPAEDIGALVLSALDKTTYDVPAPNFRTDPMPITPVLALAGVKTWGAFVKGTELVGAELDDGRLSLVPMVNRGSRRGFDHPDAEQIVRAAEFDPATIGQLLKDLFGAPVRPGGSSTS
ncbi:hypothetical protein C8D88_110207 [Lentzea atacamensis]|uniref:Uncharacterized protein n=1 Tax=Lentzea atacamensis TaxID=531938 RepID=A0A316HR16_9PSEU|nr:hypothetical protein [Lentzea atacamensis]PWK83751.1 hypothetical protein C8D88_110207 [Lentzea atacamensis]